MDRINIKYNEDKYSYTVRVPGINYEWFEIYRIHELNDGNDLFEQIIYNRGKIIISKFVVKCGVRFEIYNYNVNEVIKSFIESLVNNVSFNKLNIEHVCKCLGENLSDYTRINLIEKEPFNNYKIVLNIFLKRTNEIIGKVIIEYDDIHIDVSSEYYLEVLKELEAFLRKNQKRLLKN